MSLQAYHKILRSYIYPCHNSEMKQQHRVLIGFGIIFLLFLLSYRYSLLHDVSQLSYLNTPEAMPPFTRFITYLFMILGILPTIFMILFTALFCQTSYPARIVLYQCFGNPFAIQNGNGFVMYIVGSLLTTAALYYIFTTVSESEKLFSRPKK